MQDLSNIAAGVSLDDHLEKWEKEHNFYSLRADRVKKQKEQKREKQVPQATASIQSFNGDVPPPQEGGFIPIYYEAPTDEPTSIEDDYLATVLSPDQTIQIGNEIYRLDNETSRVYYMAADNGVIYDELIDQQPSSPDIFWYPMEQNVLDLRESGIEGTPSNSLSSFTGGSGIGCGSSAPASKAEEGVQYSRDQWLDSKLVYQSVGIYFSIVAKGESQNRFARIWWAQTSSVTLQPQAPTYVKWLPMCETAWSSDLTTYYNFKNPTTNDCTKSKATKRYYESTRGLKSYNCTVRMYDQNGAVAGPVLHIES